LVGTDSAFTKVEKITPACKATRQAAVSGLGIPVNAGSEFRKNNTMDSALVMFTAANSIYRGAPLST
jgi:hypothetical protein